MPEVLPPPPPPGARLVFVYGTLRAGASRDIRRLTPSPLCVAPGRIRGRLYHLGDYPGLLLGGSGWVHGEVYAVSSALERVLDEIEEVWPRPTGEYRKRQAWVTCPSGEGCAQARRLRCMLYEIDPARTVGRALIAGGDWLAGCSPCA